MDYTSGPYNVTIPAGVTNVTFDVSITDDNISQINEKFNLTIDLKSLPSGVTVGNPDYATVIVVDDDRKYRIRI